ncbi:MAG: hypothetical protein KDB27_27450, partial [Planctomycetales bacterium]|nr:hypothetical protein [Planctomycetales bacterium]
NANAQVSADVVADGNDSGTSQLQQSGDAPVSFSEESLDESAEAIHAALQRKCDFEFVSANLSKIADFVSQKIESSVVLDVRALDELGLSGDAMIADMRLHDVTVKAGLKRILDNLDLTFTIRNEVLLITTHDRVFGKLTTRMYPVWDLVKPMVREDVPPSGEAPNDEEGPADTRVPSISTSDSTGRLQLTPCQLQLPSNLRNGGAGGSSYFAAAVADYDTLIDIIVGAIAPDSWDDVGGEGSIQGFKGMLVVSNVQEIHDQIAALLTQLRSFPDYSKSIEGDRGSTLFLGKSHAELEQRLSKKVDVDFQDVTLQDAVDYFRQSTGVNIELDRKALDELGMNSDWDIPPTKLRNITASSALKIVLDPLDLTTSFEEGYAQVTSRDVVASKLRVVCHNARGLVEIPQSLDPELIRAEYDALIDLIVAIIAPDSWDIVGGEGALFGFPSRGVIVCSNTVEVQEEINSLLQTMRKAQSDSNNTLPKDAPLYQRPPTPPVTVVYHTPDSELQLSEISQLIYDMIEVDSWNKNGCVVKTLSDRLIVRHNRSVQRRVENLLHSLDVDVRKRQISFDL